MGFSVSKHYCLGMLQDVSYYSSADKCEFEVHSCGTSKDQIIDDFSCCSDQTLVFPGISIVKIEEKIVDLFPPFSIFNLSSKFNRSPFLSGFHLKVADKFHPPERLFPPRKINIDIQRFLI